MYNYYHIKDNDCQEAGVYTRHIEIRGCSQRIYNLIGQRMPLVHAGYTAHAK